MGSCRSERKSARAAARQARADAASAKREAALAKKDAKVAEKAAARQEKATKREAASTAKAAKAEARASKSAAKASKAAEKAAAAAATSAKSRPARALSTATDPKTAKRLVSVGKILAPALAPVLLKAAVSARTTLDNARARKLGVPVADVAAFRGPTGPAGARISGLTDAVRELAARPGGDLQITRFVDVAGTRLRDLTAVVQAAATMPRARRAEVLRAVSRELDTIDADLVSHLMNRARSSAP